MAVRYRSLHAWLNAAAAAACGAWHRGRQAAADGASWGIRLALVGMMVVLGAAGAGAGQAQPLRQVITADELETSGLVRLNDLLALVDGWTVVSMDDFRARATPMGTLDASSEWEVWVDGHPVAFDVLGTRTLNRLPVLLQDLDYVEIVRGPGVSTGPLVPAGRIHLHTRRPDEGLHGRGTYWTGNETGDPGPYKYLTGRGHNVDRLGPDIEATGEGRQPWGWFRAQALTRIHFPTYPAVIRRAQERLPRAGGRSAEYPKTEMLASAVQVQWERPSGERDLWGGVSELADFIYLEPYLREVPAQSLFARLGARGHTDAVGALRIDYHAAATINQLSERPTEPDLDPFFRVATYRAGVEARGQTDRLQMRLGARTRYDVADAFARLSDRTYAVTTVYAGATSRRLDVVPSAALQAQVDGQSVALQGHLAATLQREGGSWTTWLGYDEHLFDDGNPLWLWTRRGYPLLDTLGVAYTLADRYGKRRTLRLETAVQLRLTPAWRASAGAFVRHHRGLTLPRRALSHYDEEWRYFEGATTLAGGAHGTVAGGYVQSRVRWSPRLRQQLYAGLQHRLGGSEAFAEAWRARPVLQARTSATLRLVPTFVLHTRLAFRSATRWPGLDGAASLSGGAYDNEVPAAIVIDAAATKWLWDRRLRGTLGVRNVLNEAYRQHPLGAAFPLSLRIQVSARL